MFPVALLHEILRADQMAIDWLTVYLGQAKNFIESLPTTTAADLVPGMDLWKLWMPGDLNAAETPSAEVQGKDAQGKTRRGKTRPRTTNRPDPKRRWLNDWPNWSEG